ncbi:MAG TPA: exodeoxyribonuclease III [Deltaproteobacteria bacterium]|nr:MAG: exodeoxyribonuclease III [Deltaproteobacteria bacterium GWA2_45_12]HBF13470.1 exodeoxyribonuclease III [Deltaproteobacteria bacterium]
MKFISWNVNGIRSVLGKGFLQYVDREDPDILCLQETKAHPDQVDKILSHYQHFWNSAEKKGYSGTAIFTKVEPLSVTYGLGLPEHDTEGRVITLEFKNYYLVNVYTPNAQRELTRLKYRMKWDADFLKYVKKLEEKKPVIFCGDLNVAHKEIDLKNYKSNYGNAGFTEQERGGFDNIVNAGFIDSFRYFNQDPGHYTWWSYMFQARSKNVGWRIDYFCLSQDLKSILKDAHIYPHVMGSDHCPVGVIIK